MTQVMPRRWKLSASRCIILLRVLILGVLAAVAVPTFATVRGNAAASSAEATAQAIKRNANAIASSVNNGEVLNEHLRQAASEVGNDEGRGRKVTVTGETAAPDGSNNAKIAVSVKAGNATRCVTIGIDDREDDGGTPPIPNPDFRRAALAGLTGSAWTEGPGASAEADNGTCPAS